MARRRGRRQPGGAGSPAERASHEGARKEGARKAIFDVVEGQLRDGQPKEVGGTLIRLCLLGMSRDTAMRHIAYALLIAMSERMAEGRAYDEELYVAKLQQLPGLAQFDDE
jgi:hypothetical protein